MTNSNNTIRSILLAGAAGVAGTSMLVVGGPARADECLLDTINDGFATATGDINTSDTDLGANSGGNDSQLACGVSAVASAQNTTALGADAQATNNQAIALGLSIRGPVVVVRLPLVPTTMTRLS